MTIDILELNELIFGKPQLVSLKTMKNVMFVVDNITNGQNLGLLQQKPETRASDVYYNQEKALGLIQIKGVLQNNEGGWDSMCGITSYEAITGQADYLASQNIKTLVLEIDSGGGEAYGVFEAADYVKALAQEKGFKIISYVDGYAASAAYAWAAISDEIVVNPQAEVGSIGVVVQLRNYSEYEKKEGITTSYVYAGDSKIPYTADGSFSEEFIKELQDKVDNTYETFVTHIANNRSLSTEAVKNTQAKTFLPEKALSLGLADSIMTKVEFTKYIENLGSDEKAMSLFSNTKNQGAETDVSKLELQVQTLTSTLETKEQEYLTVLATAKEEKEQLETSLKELQASFDEFKQEAELKERKQLLSTVVAEDKVEDMLESTKTLNQAAFNTILSTLQVKQEKLSEGMEELGGNPESEAPADFSTNLTNFIKSKKSAK